MKRLRTRTLTLILTLLCLTAARAAATTPGAVQRAYEDYEKFYLQCENAKIEIQLLEHGVVRLEVFADGIDSKAETYMTLPGALRKIVMDRNEKAGEISSTGVKVKYTMNPLSIEFDNPEGKFLLAIKPDGINWNADGSYSVTFARTVDDHFYGLGEPLPGVIGEPVKIDYRGLKRSIWNQHIPPADLGLPFFMNPRGYGLMAENHWKAEFDFGRQGAFTYSATGGPLRLWIFPSGSYYEILDAYTQLTGRTPMPPRWATGYLQSRFGYVNEKDFRWLMDNFRSRRIPCDALIYDLYWFGSGGMGNLWWTPENFPDPEGFQKESHKRGFKTIVIVEPYIMGSSTNQMEVFARKLAVMNDKKQPYLFQFWGREGSMLLDFMNPKTQEWFAKQVKRIHLSGVDAWWTDLTEPEVDFPGMVYFGGTPREGGHNLQAILMHKGMDEMYKREFPGERLFIMSRSGFVGDWRYGSSIWSGDVTASWNHLRDQVPTGISTMLSGYGIWNSDTGGFHRHPSAELYTRWMQFSAFCPVFRAHGNHDVREPWSFGEEAEENLRALIDLRYRLSPYLYTLFSELNRAGRPTMRALFLEFPDDPKAYAVQDAFMYGPSLLVAPVTKDGAREKSVYLPKGAWTDFWTEAVYEGPATVKVDAPLDRIPLFVRPGAIIPMGPEMQYMEQKPPTPVTLHIYPAAGASSFRLYEDDGQTTAYQNGGYALTPIQVKPGATLKIVVGDRAGAYKGMPATRAWFLAVHHADAPGTVKLNGKVIPGKPEDVEKVPPASAAWSYDPQTRLLKVNIPARATGFNVEVGGKK